MPHRRTTLAVLVLLAGCSPTPTPLVHQGYQGKPPLGAAIAEADMPLGSWAWIPFADTSCGDGSPAGLAVNRGSGPDLVVFFDGGGACWDYWSCASGTAMDKAYGPAQFEVERTDFIPSSFTDRSHLPAAIADATVVFLPYCTGDVHGGDNVKTYGNAVVSETWHHVGHANVMAFLARLGPTFPSPRKLVVAGSSAGGFGALVNYEALRWYWPDASGYLVDDSGPALVHNDVPADFRDAWYSSWGLASALDPICPDCRTDLSAAFTALATLHPRDRIAFVSHAQDPVMSAFMLVTPAGFETALRRLDSTVIAPLPRAHVFYDSDGGIADAHMLLTPLTPFAGDYVASHVEGGISLEAWLGQMVSDDSAWASVLPP